MTKAVAKPSRGRPADPRKDELIRAVAGRLFMANGVQGTTMDQIAHQAGVSKLTLYRKYPDKNALFLAVVGCRCQEYMPDSLFDAGNATNPRAALIRIGQALLKLCTTDEGVNLHRIITSECCHNPDLAQQFVSGGAKKVKANVRALMASFKQQQRLAITDIDDATDFFCALILGSEMVKHANMGIAKPTPQKIKDYVGRAVGFFLQAYANK